MQQEEEELIQWEGVVVDNGFSLEIIQKGNDYEDLQVYFCLGLKSIFSDHSISSSATSSSDSDKDGMERVILKVPGSVCKEALALNQRVSVSAHLLSSSSSDNPNQIRTVLLAEKFLRITPTVQKGNVEQSQMELERTQIVSTLCKAVGNDHVSAEMILLQLVACQSVSLVDRVQQQQKGVVLPFSLTLHVDSPTQLARFLHHSVYPQSVILPLSIDFLNRAQFYSELTSQTTDNSAIAAADSTLDDDAYQTQISRGLLQVPPRTLLIFDGSVLGTGQLTARGVRNYRALCDLLKMREIRISPTPISSASDGVNSSDNSGNCALGYEVVVEFGGACLILMPNSVDSSLKKGFIDTTFTLHSLSSTTETYFSNGKSCGDDGIGMGEYFGALDDGVGVFDIPENVSGTIQKQFVSDRQLTRPHLTQPQNNTPLENEKRVIVKNSDAGQEDDSCDMKKERLAMRNEDDLANRLLLCRYMALSKGQSVLSHQIYSSVCELEVEMYKRACDLRELRQLNSGVGSVSLHDSKQVLVGK